VKRREQNRTQNKKQEQNRKEEDENREEEDKSRQDDTCARVAIGKRVLARNKKTRQSAKTSNSAGKSKSAKNRAARPKAEDKRLKTKAAHNPQENPRPDEPENPTEPDAPAKKTETDVLGRSDAPAGTEAAPGPVNRPAANGGPVCPMSGAVYDRHDYQFGRRVFLALKLPGDPDNGAVDETTSFASTWHKIRRGRSPPDEDALGRRLLKEAARLARKKKQMNKGAVWNDLAVRIANAH